MNHVILKKCEMSRQVPSSSVLCHQYQYLRSTTPWTVQSGYLIVVLNIQSSSKFKNQLQTGKTAHEESDTTWVLENKVIEEQNSHSFARLSFMKTQYLCEYHNNQFLIYFSQTIKIVYLSISLTREQQLILMLKETDWFYQCIFILFQERHLFSHSLSLKCFSF